MKRKKILTQHLKMYAEINLTKYIQEFYTENYRL
jgi:hypothetical protein